ncbi:MAG: IclR family transcriptional regulator [Lautropia sp.]
MSLQTLDRAMAALHVLAHAELGGARLVDVQQALGLAKPTAHRLLAGLVKHRMAVQDPDTRRYQLGPTISSLAQFVPRLNDDVHRACLPAVRRLASRSGQACLLLLRFGLETFCVDRFGGSPASRRATPVGLLRPLGLGASGMSIVSEMADADVRQVFRHVRPRLGSVAGGGGRDLDAEVAFTRKHGYAITHGSLVRGMCGIGIALRDSHGQALASIGVLLPENHAAGSDGRRIIHLIQEERDNAERALAATLSAQSLLAAGGMVRRHRLM